MTTRQLDPNDVLADLESFLADNDPTTRGLDLDTQAAITTLLWEVAGIVTIAEQTKQSPNTARGLARLRTIAARLLTILDFSEEAFDLAETQIAAIAEKAIPLNGHGGNRQGNNYNLDIPSIRGDSPEYLTARIARDRPDILVRSCSTANELGDALVMLAASAQLQPVGGDTWAR